MPGKGPRLAGSSSAKYSKASSIGKKMFKVLGPLLLTSAAAYVEHEWEHERREDSREEGREEERREEHQESQQARDNRDERREDGKGSKPRRRPAKLQKHRRRSRREDSDTTEETISSSVEARAASSQELRPEFDRVRVTKEEVFRGEETSRQDRRTEPDIIRGAGAEYTEIPLFTVPGPVIPPAVPDPPRPRHRTRPGDIRDGDAVYHILPYPEQGASERRHRETLSRPSHRQRHTHHVTRRYSSYADSHPYSEFDVHAAQVATVAGIVEALHVGYVGGDWIGQKGLRVATTAASSYATNISRKRHVGERRGALAEVADVVTGVGVSRLVHGSVRDMERESERPKGGRAGRRWSFYY